LQDRVTDNGVLLRQNEIAIRSVEEQWVTGGVFPGPKRRDPHRELVGGIWVQVLLNEKFKLSIGDSLLAFPAR